MFGWTNWNQSYLFSLHAASLTSLHRLLMHVGIETWHGRAIHFFPSPNLGQADMIKLTHSTRTHTTPIHTARKIDLQFI
jgi:hypothetical protein